MLRITADEYCTHAVRERRHVAEARLTIERYDDVEALGSGSFHPARKIELREQVAKTQRCRAEHVGRLVGRVQIEHADVRLIHVRRARRPHVRRDAVLVGHPEQRARVRDEWMMNGAVLLGHLDALQPLGKTLRHVLLEKPRLRDAGVIALHRDGTRPDVREHHGRDRLVVRREVALGDGRLRSLWREQYFVGMADLDDRLRVARAHVRTSSRREWRSLPCTGHSMNATCTTICGRTQWARTRGSPTDRVNGGFGISSASRRARKSTSSFVSKPVPTFPANTNSSPSK